MHPLTILLPCYNSEHRIRECLESLKKQSCKKFQLMVSENNSSDQSRSLIDQSLKNADFDVEIICREETVPATENWSSIFYKSTSDFFLFLDSEDSISDNYVEGFYKALEENPSSVVFVPRFYELGTNGEARELIAPRVLYEQPYYRKLIDFLDMPSMMGTGYPIYSVFKRDSCLPLWNTLFSKSPCPSAADDVALTLAAIITFPKNISGFNGLLNHYSKIIVDQERLQYNNHHDLKTHTHPNVKTDLIKGLGYYISSETDFLEKINRLSELDTERFFLRRDIARRVLEG